MTKEMINLIETARMLSDSEWEEMKEKLLEEAKDSETEARVYLVLKEMGISASLKGYNYIKRGIILTIENPEILKTITKGLYCTIAEEYETTWKAVERMIRHGIEVTCDSGNTQKMQEIFGYTYVLANHPSNKKFIAGIAEYIRNS